MKKQTYIQKICSILVLTNENLFDILSIEQPFGMFVRFASEGLNMNTNTRTLARRRQVLRQKLLLGFASLFVIVILSFMVGSISANAKSEREQSKYMTMVTVSFQDTLSDIAEKYMDPMHYDSLDSFIEEIACINHVLPDQIQAGSILMVPYFA